MYQPSETKIEEKNIRLLEEKLVVKRNKRKIGEVIVRKEIETRMVQVPVRREKLIVEQVGLENRQLVEIDLGQEEIEEQELTETSNSCDTYIVKGEFLSLEAVSALLKTIALQDRHGCLKVKVEIVVDNPQAQESYQAMFERTLRR